MRWIILLLALLLAWGCGGGTPSWTGWFVKYGTVQLSPSPNGLWQFQFPQEPGYMGYVLEPIGPLEPNQTITATFALAESTDAEFWEYGPGAILPATVHLMIEIQNDDMQEPYGRFWFDAQASQALLQSGTISLTAPLDWQQWSGVYGQKNQAAFLSALQNVGYVGLTFGGVNFWGHGAGMAQGEATFALVSFEIN